MKPATMKSVLLEKLKEMEKYLKRSEKDQKDMRKEKHLTYASDILEGLSHQIGYMTGAMEQTKDFIRMIDMTDGDFQKEREAIEENRKELRQQLSDLIKRRNKSTK